MKLTINTAPVFEPLLQPSRYKGAWGGRASGKSHFFGEGVVEKAVMKPGLRAICIREVQHTLAESVKALIETKIVAMGVQSMFNITRDRIDNPGGGVTIFKGMNEYNAENIKSLEGFDLALIEEAQTMSERSLELLRPTIRAPGSEIWAAWNPRFKKDAIDKFLRQGNVEGAIVIQANWSDNPWFTPEMEQERQTDLRLYPDRYEHIWEGGYIKAFEGAYYAKLLAAARRENRIGFFPRDPLLPVRAFFDLGGAGATADAMAIWLVQFVGEEIRILDYIEGQGQVLEYYVNELRARDYQSAQCFLPHDGMNTNSVTGKRYEEHLRDAKFWTTSVPNQGMGAAMMRIEAARRIFPRCRFNEATTETGRDTLGYYHEKKDPKRGDVGLGPNHDWSSHCADAFGLMAICWEDPNRNVAVMRQIQAIDDVNPHGQFTGRTINFRNFPDAIEE